MTKAREAVREILESAGEPLSALDVGTLAGSLCDTATIYRALHFLEENGLAESFVLNCLSHGTERYYVSHNVKHRHWFHCERCHNFVDLGACRVEPMLLEMGKAAGVVIRNHTLYATGICAACIEKEGARTCGERGIGCRPAQPEEPFRLPSGSPRPP